MDATSPDNGRPAAETVVLTLSGTPARDDGVRLEAALARLPADVPVVVLECRDLGGLSADMATVVARWWRRLADAGRSLRIRHPNVVVRWVLERHLGSEVLAQALGGEDHRLPRNRVPYPSPARPRRDLAGQLRRIMAAATPDGTPDDALGELLREAGLADRVRLVRRRDDRLVAPGEETVAVPADGWLGSLLAGADCPVTVAELRRSGLPPAEEGLLLWAEADVVIPLVHAGRLEGLLLLGIGRPGGWSALRSGEVLALDLVAHLLARHLASAAPVATGSPAPNAAGEISPATTPPADSTVPVATDDSAVERPVLVSA